MSQNFQILWLNLILIIFKLGSNITSLTIKLIWEHV